MFDEPERLLSVTIGESQSCSFYCTPIHRRHSSHKTDIQTNSSRERWNGASKEKVTEIDYEVRTYIHSSSISAGLTYTLQWESDIFHNYWIVSNFHCLLITCNHCNCNQWQNYILANLAGNDNAVNSLIGSLDEHSSVLHVWPTILKFWFQVSCSRVLSVLYKYASLCMCAYKHV